MKVLMPHTNGDMLVSILDVYGCQKITLMKVSHHRTGEWHLELLQPHKVVQGLGVQDRVNFILLWE